MTLNLIKGYISAYLSNHLSVFKILKEAQINFVYQLLLTRKIDNRITLHVQLLHS